jgi:acetyl esterase/lipase
MAAECLLHWFLVWVKKPIHWVLMLLLCLGSRAYGCAPADYSLEQVDQKLRAQFASIAAVVYDAQLPVRHWPDLVYKKRGSQVLALDIFAPLNTDAPKRLPGVLLVHGGGWCAGSRALMVPLAQRLAQRGYVVAAVSYSLTSQAPYPAAIEDVQVAVAYLRKHASDWQLNPSALALVGASSGGQIATLAGLTLSKPLTELVPLAGVQAMINIDGLSDFTTPLALRYENDRTRATTVASEWLAGRFEAQPARWREASPVNYLTAAAPPMLFITGKAPRFSSGVETMMAQLDQWQIANKRVEFAQAPHSFWLFEPWFTPTLNAIDKFLRSLDAFAQADASSASSAANALLESRSPPGK